MMRTVRDLLENLFGCSGLFLIGAFSSETSFFLNCRSWWYSSWRLKLVDHFSCTLTASSRIQIPFYKSDIISWRADVLTFQWQVDSMRADRRHQRHVSRLRHPFPSALTTSRLASLADLFSPTPIFFFPFSTNGFWSQPISYISLNTNTCTLTDSTFALGGISIPCSFFTSHFSLAF